MKRTLSCVILTLWSITIASVLHGGRYWDARAQSVEKPSLSKVIFMGLPPIKILVPAHFQEDRQPCIRRYLDAIAPDSYLREYEVPSAPDKALVVKRHALAEQMVVILGRDVRKEAEAFASAVPLKIEWEGMSEGPLEEANFVDHWLRSQAGTPIAPFLHLFKAHRLRAGYEAARAGQEKDLWPILARRYREALDKAKSSTHPLISCIADDLEVQTYVYLEGQGRP